MFAWGPPPPPSLIHPDDLAALMTGAHKGAGLRPVRPIPGATRIVDNC